MQRPPMRTTGDLAHRLRSDLRGEVVEPGDPEYDRARSVYYSGFDRRPAVVARPADAADVATVVVQARDSGVSLAVRSGGHSIAGHGVAEGGIVLDLSAMGRLEIEPVGRTAWAETGLTAGEYTTAVGAHGLATGFGDAPSVGIGGITLGGGLGFLHRKHGLTIDNLLAAEIVTASGELVTADPESHPDLFWAIRGGGGNFGVATRFKYRLAEVGEVVGGMLILPATPAGIVELLSALAEAPESLSGMVNIMYAPPAPFLPPEVHGRLIAMMHLVHCGTIEEGEREFARLRALAAPLADTVQRLRYPDIYEGGNPPQPMGMATRSFFLDSVDHAAADMLVDALGGPEGPMRVAQFRPMGGAVARVSRDATAFAHRDRGILCVVASAYEQRGEAAERKAWTDGVAAALRQGEPGAYVGFMGEETEARVREAYPAATWARLASIKARYDPGNLFHLNQNVPPVE